MEQTEIATTTPVALEQANRSTPAATSFSRGKKRSPSLSRDEMNLAEFPLAVLSTRTNPKVKTLEFSDCSRKANGELVERKWIITGADKFGLPTSTDDDVVLGLMRLSMDQQFRERKIFFTRYELLKILRWSTEGRSYSRLVKSLDRLSGVRIRSSNSFYDNSTKSYQTCNFGIIDAYELNDHRGGKGKPRGDHPKSYFIWSEMLFDSFKAGFIKKLDLDFYFCLKSAISRRLYRYLDKHFYYKSSIEMSLNSLAFDRLGLSRSYKYISSIKQQLEPALEELLQLGFLSAYEYRGSSSATTICLSARSAAANRRVETEQREDAEKIPSLNSINEPKGQALVRELSSRGMAEKQAHKLIEQKSEAEYQKIKAIINYYDELVSKQDKKVSRNSVGFLYRAVEHPYKFTVPQRFWPEEEAGFGAGKGRDRRNSRGRPELRIYRAKTASEKDRTKGSVSKQGDQSALKSRYQDFFEKEISFALSQMSATEVTSLYSGVEQKMKCLRGVLKQERFQQAVDGCVRQEIMKSSKIPDFEAWKAQQ